MPKRNDGNETDLRVRTTEGAPSLDGDNPFTGAHPAGVSGCAEHGSQTDLPITTDVCSDPINGATEVVTPDGTFPFNWADQSEYCPDGFSLQKTDTLLLTVLRSHFFYANKIRNPDLKQFTWSQDPTESKIRIVMNTTWDGAQAGQLPAIVLKRGKQRPQRVAMGDRGQTGDAFQGRERYVRFIQGTHRVICMGGSDGQTEILVQEVFDLFNCVSPVIRSDLPMHDFQVADLSEVGILEDVGGTFAATVDLVYVYEYAWTLQRIGPLLRRTRVVTSVDLDLGTEPSDVGVRTC